MKILICATIVCLLLAACGGGGSDTPSSTANVADGVWELKPSDTSAYSTRSHIEADDHPDHGSIIEIRGNEWTIYDATTAEATGYDVYKGTVDNNGNVVSGNLGVATIIVTGDSMSGLSIYFTDFSGHERKNDYAIIGTEMTEEIKQQYGLPEPVVAPIPDFDGFWFENSSSVGMHIVEVRGTTYTFFDDWDGEDGDENGNQGWETTTLTTDDDGNLLTTNYQPDGYDMLKEIVPSPSIADDEMDIHFGRIPAELSQNSNYSRIGDSCESEGVVVFDLPCTASAPSSPPATVPTTGFPNGHWYLDNDVYDSAGNHLYAQEGELLTVEGSKLTVYQEVRDGTPPDSEFDCWDRTIGSYDPATNALYGFEATTITFSGSYADGLTSTSDLGSELRRYVTPSEFANAEAPFTQICP